MKTIYYYLIYPASLIIGSSQLTTTLSASYSQSIQPIPRTICAENIAWLRSTIHNNHQFASKRKRVVQSVTQVIKHFQAFQVTEKIIEDLHTLLQKEQSEEMLQYLIFIVGKLRIKQLAQRVLMTFYTHTQNELLCLSIIEALKLIKVPEAAKLVLYTTQNCSRSIYQEAWQLPYYLGCERAVLERLATILACNAQAMPLYKQLRFIEAIRSIKNRDFIDGIIKSGKGPSFTNKMIDAFCHLLKYTKEPYIVTKVIRLFFYTYSAKLDKVLTDLMQNNQVTDLSIKKSIIEWIGSVNKFVRRKRCSAILMEKAKEEQLEICLAAIHELAFKSFTPTLTARLLTLLAEQVDGQEDREGLVVLLEESPLLKYKTTSLFYDSKKEYHAPKSIFFSSQLTRSYNAILVKQKSYQYLRAKMIRLFRLILNKIEQNSISLYGMSNLTDESSNLVECLAYLKDDDISDCLWDMLQREKKSYFLLEELKLPYFRLYQQSPFLLLHPSWQKKLLLLYISHFTLFLDQPFFPDLTDLIYYFLSLDIKYDRLPFESLPIIYTGTNKKIRKKYRSSTYLKIFQ